MFRKWNRCLLQERGSVVKLEDDSPLVEIRFDLKIRINLILIPFDQMSELRTDFYTSNIREADDFSIGSFVAV